MTASGREGGVADRPNRTLPDPPGWAQWCDVSVVLLLATAVGVMLTGGFRVHILGDLRISMRSPGRLAEMALLVVIVRHVFVPWSALHRRLADGFATIGARPLWSVLYVVCASLLAMTLMRDYRPTLGLMSLIQFGDRREATVLPELRAMQRYVLPSSYGYDGQFYAQLAIDPSLRDPDLLRALDATAYRARRILFSWTAYVVGLGRPAWVLQVYAWQNVAAWLLLAVVLLRWCPPGSARHFAAWFACVFSVGMMTSTRKALTDGPSMVLIALAVLATERGRSALATGILALAGLGRETNVLAAAALPMPADSGVRTRVRYLLAIAATGLPLVAWTLYVRAMLGKADAGIGNIGLPFAGYADKWTSTISELIASGWWIEARFSALSMVGLTVQAAYVAWRWRLWATSPWWRVGAAYACLMAVAGASVWAGHAAAIDRVVLPLTVAFNVVVLRERWFWPLILAGNLAVFAEVWYL